MTMTASCRILVIIGGFHLFCLCTTACRLCGQFFCCIGYSFGISYATKKRSAMNAHANAKEDAADATHLRRGISQSGIFSNAQINNNSAEPKSGDVFRQSGDRMGERKWKRKKRAARGLASRNARPEARRRAEPRRS